MVKLELAKLFKFGNTREVIVKHGVEVKPPSSKRWLILDGVYEVADDTADCTLFVKRSGLAAEYKHFTEIVAAGLDRTGFHPVFNTYADGEQAQFSLWIIEDGDSIYHANASGSKAILQVLEW